eukprot:jgi/Mesen1/2420/ME000157S01560
MMTRKNFRHPFSTNGAVLEVPSSPWKEKGVAVTDALRRILSDELHDLQVASTASASEKGCFSFSSGGAAVTAQQSPPSSSGAPDVHMRSSEAEEPQSATSSQDRLWDWPTPGGAAGQGHVAAWEGLSPNEYRELLLEMEQALHSEIETEKRRQEAALLEQAEEALRFDEAASLAAADHYASHAVVCPICKVKPLHQHREVIFCSCGLFRLNTQYDQVNLEFLGARLQESLQEHTDLDCAQAPYFTIEEHFGVTALYMRCLSCESFKLVV